MARSRRSGSETVPFSSVVAAALVSALLAGTGLGYVWHRNRNKQLSQEIRQTQAQRQRLRLQSESLDSQLNRLRSVDRLRARVEELNLGLAMPPPQQILRLPEPSAATDAALAAVSVLRVAARH